MIGMVVVAVLACLLGITLGYAARMREQLMENLEADKKQKELDKIQRTLLENDKRMADLVKENHRLRGENAAHERNLEMLLREVGGE